MADLSPELTARIQSLESSYADNPGRYFVALAGAWREAGEIGRAEEILRENLKRFPGLSAHVLLGRCLADRGAVQEAANEFQYVLSIDAQNLIALRTLAEMAAASGRRAEAEKWYNGLLAVDPMNAEARAALQELARGGADAAVADQPVQLGTGWGGASEPLAAAGGADADGADEFGMIDLSTPDASAADASGVAADDDAGEWGDLPFDIPSTTGAAPASTPSGAGSDFDAFGFGSVDLDAQPGGPETDETGAVGAWLDADARQDPGESAADDRGALAPLGADDDLLDAPLAGADLPFLDADDTVPADLPLLVAHDPVPADLPLLDAHDPVPADLPLLDAEAAGAPGFPAFDAPSHDDGFPVFSSAPADATSPLPAFDADADDGDHADHPVDAEVVTETMAELYAAQGLLQQSADTYRELIRQRGEEPGLVRRLAEIEARLHPAAAEAPAPAADEAPDWLASVDAFAMGGAAAGLAAVHMSPEPDPADAAPEPPAFDPVEEPAYADAAVVADFAATEAAAGADDFAPPPAEAAAAEAAPAADAFTDPFADSFVGGFEGAGAPAAAPEPAFAAAPPVPGDADREPWQAPSVRETEPVPFDLIVVEEDGDTVAAPPEVVADVSADWAIAAAPLGDDEDAAEEATAASATASASRASSMRAYFSSLLAWTPGQSAASAAAPAEPAAEAPAFDAAPIAADEPVAEAPAFDAPPAAEPIVVGEPAAEAPAEPTPTADPWAESPTSAEPTAAADPWAESPAPAEPTPAADPWAESPASAEPSLDPWAESPGPDEPTPAEPAAAEEPWTEQPAPPAADLSAFGDAPAAEASPAANGEPWAAAPEAAPQAAGDIPLFDLDAEPWAGAPPAAEPPSIDSFELSDEIAPPAPPAAAEPEEALPWELPAEPAATTPEPAADAGAFSFEDFFSGGAPAAAETPAAPEPEPAPLPQAEPEPELPSSFVPSLAFEPVAPPAAPATPPPAAPAAPAASSAPAGGQDEEDEDLESFQAWLQSLKR
ncbi:MAG TPA: tetratricopeptide repeat protein [Longimicrobium sp.]